MLYSTLKKETSLILAQLKTLEKQKREFEGKYGMSSEEFYEKFEGGRLGDKQDFFLWASSIDIYSRLKDEYDILMGLVKQCKV